LALRLAEHARSVRLYGKSIAASALTDIRHLDLDRGGEAFLRLAKDASSEARFRDQPHLLAAQASYAKHIGPLIKPSQARHVRCNARPGVMAA
jgi:hypothetical protein